MVADRVQSGIPTFIVAGERRAGTTSLYHTLRQHPDICMYPKSEMSYFIEAELKGRRWRDGDADPGAWEASHSVGDYVALFGDGDQRPAVGHKGADLLFWEPAHDRMRRFAPNARIVVSLRNPVDRAWSHYWNEVGKGRETLDFDQAVERETERATSSAWARFHLSYVARGFYATSLERLFRAIPREQVLVVTMEDCRGDGGETLGHVYRFLGVNPDRVVEASSQHRNRNWTTVPRPWTRHGIVRPVTDAYTWSTGQVARVLSRNRERRREIRRVLQAPVRTPASGFSMEPEIREHLAHRFAPEIEALEEILGRTFAELRG